MKPRLLIVDDEPRMAEIVGMVLRREGYDVETFTSSAAAIERHEEDAFDLVLTDLRMPAPDGLEVLRRAQERDPDLPVILITAHGTVSSAIEAMGMSLPYSASIPGEDQEKVDECHRAGAAIRPVIERFKGGVHSPVPPLVVLPAGGRHRQRPVSEDAVGLVGEVA